MGVEPGFDNTFRKGTSIHKRPRLESVNLYNPLCQMIVGSETIHKKNAEEEMGGDVEKVHWCKYSNEKWHSFY